VHLFIDWLKAKIAELHPQAPVADEPEFVVHV
jgi:hypothetical protein